MSVLSVDPRVGAAEVECAFCGGTTALPGASSGAAAPPGASLCSACLSGTAEFLVEA